MTYCDTNILTSFVNKENSKKILNDGYWFIKLNRQKEAEEILKEGKCVVAREPLIKDLKEHQAGVGAVLTGVGFGKLKIKDVRGGLGEGKNILNQVCKKMGGRKLNQRELNFKSNYCFAGKLKPDREIKEINPTFLEDINHLGSAVLLGEKEFYTRDIKDFGAISPFVHQIKIKTE